MMSICTTASTPFGPIARAGPKMFDAWRSAGPPRPRPTTPGRPRRPRRVPCWQWPLRIGSPKIAVARAVLCSPMAAARISLAEIEGRFAGHIAEDEVIEFDPVREGLRARRRRRLGAFALSEQPIRLVPSESSAQLLAQGLMALGLDRLPFGEALTQWRHRVAFMRRIEGPDWPDLSATALQAAAPEWLAHALAGKTALDEL